jgi:hypothetical protein
VFAGKLNRNPIYIFNELAKKYGDIYTIWFGSKPVIFINSIQLGIKAYNQIECSNRGEEMMSKISDAIFGGFKSFLLLDYNEDFKKLRKISVNGIRYCIKY